MKISREIKAAIIVILGVTFLIVGISYLKSTPLFTFSRTFYAIYSDVDGLRASTPVTLNGLKIGIVKDISFLNKSGKLLVTLSVENKFGFSKNSKLELASQNLIGGKSIRVLPVFDRAPWAKNGDTLATITQKGIPESILEQVNPMVHKIDRLISSFELTLSNLNLAMSEQNQKALAATLLNLKKTTESASQLMTNTEASLTASSKNAEVVSANLARVSARIAENNLADKLNSLLIEFDTLAHNVNSQKGTVGKLIRDPNLYNNLEKSSKELELLLQDVRLHPKRFAHFSIFGRKDKNDKPN